MAKVERGNTFVAEFYLSLLKVFESVFTASVGARFSKINEGRSGETWGKNLRKIIASRRVSLKTAVFPGEARLLR